MSVGRIDRLSGELFRSISVRYNQWLFVGSYGTTITVLVASYLHYVKGYNVAVVDCDFPQYSIHDMRKRDMDMTMKDDHYKAQAYRTAWNSS